MRKSEIVKRSIRCGVLIPIVTAPNDIERGI